MLEQTVETLESDNTMLTDERDTLEQRVRNLTREKEALQLKVKNLNEEIESQITKVLNGSLSFPDLHVWVSIPLILTASDGWLIAPRP